MAQIDSSDSNPLRGVFWMLLTGMCFVAVNALVKLLGSDMPPQQSAFLRYVLALGFLIPMIRPILNAKITPRLWGLFALRGLMHAAAVMLWFYAMTQIPLADVTALNYLAPVFVSIGAAVFLGEKMALRRIAAIAVALIGMVIILRPGVREISPGHWGMLISAAIFGGSYLIAKILADAAPPTVVVGMMSIWVTIGLTPFALAVWVTPTLYEIAILFCVACFATLGHYLMTLAFRAAPVTVTQPVTFLQLVWAVLLGVVFFDEAIDLWVVFGGALILGAISFITWREAVLKRRPITPPSPATKL